MRDGESERIPLELADLVRHPGWIYLNQIAEQMIQVATPKITEFSSEDATRIASKNVYIAGIKAVLNIPNQKKYQVK